MTDEGKRGNETWLAVSAALMLALGCAGDEGGRSGNSGGPGIGSVGQGETGETPGDDDDDDDAADDDDDDDAADGDDDDDDAADDGSPGFDVGSAETGGLPPQDEGCTKVDFLFVIDNSVSMEDEQAALIAAFPGFIAEIQNTLEAGSDYHILVTDTDEWGRCNTVGWDGMNPGHQTCNNYIENTAFEECDRVRGAGVVHPAGGSASNMPCFPFGGNRYLVEGAPDLAGTFACTATVGAAGHPSARPMDSMIAALQPAINGPGGCNDGFLRDDAILVITFISDDPNYEDMPEPLDWYNAVVAAKNGDPESVVVVGITPAWPGCKSGNPKGEHWAEFVAMWGENGLHGNVCSDAAEYVMYFQQAVEKIEQVCNEFEPPG